MWERKHVAFGGRLVCAGLCVKFSPNWTLHDILLSCGVQFLVCPRSNHFHSTFTPLGALTLWK